MNTINECSEVTSDKETLESEVVSQKEERHSGSKVDFMRDLNKRLQIKPHPVLKQPKQYKSDVQEENETCPIDQESDIPASPVQIKDDLKLISNKENIVESAISSSYHVCPTNVTFQFDTTFMYLIAVVVCKILFSELKKLYARKEGALNYLLLILFTNLALYGTYYCASSTLVG